MKKNETVKARAYPGLSGPAAVDRPAKARGNFELQAPGNFAPASFFVRIGKFCGKLARSLAGSPPARGSADAKL